MASKPQAKAAPKKAPLKAAAMNQACGVISGGYKPTAADKAREKKYQAQDDLRTLQRAAEVKADPARVKMAQAEAASQVKALSTVLKR